MSSEKVIHDIPFVIEAARRQLHPTPPAKEPERHLVVDEMMLLMESSAVAVNAQRGHK